jgi:Arc/MetJ family transcription regulator
LGHAQSRLSDLIPRIPNGEARDTMCRYIIRLTHHMRTNIVIDDKLMRDTLRVTGLKTKREAVELGLRTLVRLRQQEQIKRFRGKLKWKGDLQAMRTDE